MLQTEKPQNSTVLKSASLRRSMVKGQVAELSFLAHPTMEFQSGHNCERRIDVSAYTVFFFHVFQT